MQRRWVLSLTETISIPAYSEVCTLAHVSAACNGVWLVEGCRPDLPGLVAEAVVSPSEVEPVGCVPVSICNPSSTMATIHKGTRIGRATHLDATLVASVTDTTFKR